MTSRSLAPLLVAAACASSKPSVTQPAPPPTSMTMGAPVEPSPAPSPTPPIAAAKAHKVRTVEGITEYKLDNGLTVLLFPDETQSTITVNVTYLVGSRLEGYGETGMAHLLEHMMFKGTARHRDIGKLLEERGGLNNASTDYDRTNYFETLPASQENLDWALDMEADRMLNATISPDDLKTEFSVVRNEFESNENDPSNILDERVTETAYLWHNYGKPVIGSRSDIERVPVPALRKFYEKYYQPDDAILVVSGKFDDAGALASIEKLFGAIAKPTRALTDSYTVEPVQDGERDVTLRRNGDVYVIELAYHTLSGVSPDFVAAAAAADVLAHEGAGRLYKKLVETRLAATVTGDQAARRDPFIATFVATVRDAKNVDKVEKIMIEEIEGLGASKIDDKEVERFRVATEKELELAMTSSRSIALALSEFAALGDWRTLFAFREAAKKVTAADVARVAKKFYKQSNRTLGKFIPTKDSDRAPLEQAGDVAAYVKGIEGGDVKERGEVFAATLDNIEARTQRKELKGGIKAALLAKKTRGGKVTLVLRMHWGDEKSLQNKGRVPEVMGAMMSRGTTKKSYQELQDEQDKLKARVSISASADGLVLRIDTLRDKLPAALDLAAEMLKDSAFPDKQLEVVRNELLATYEQQQKDPGTVAFNTLAQLTTKWPKGDPRRPATIAEQIDGVKKIAAADLKQFYKDFVGVGHAELAIVGDFDPAAMSAQVEKLFAAWQTKKPYARLAQKVWTDVPGQQKSIDIKDKEQTTIALGEAVALKDSDDDYAAWLMVSQVVGGDSGSRTWMRLREHEGLSYGVATWAFADAFDEAGGFGGYAIVAPQNLAKAKASLLDELDKIAAGKIGDEELKRAKDTWLKEQDTELSSDGWVVQELARELYSGRTTEFLKKLRAKVAALTPADVEKVAQKRMDPKRIVIVDAGDLSKAAAAPGK